MKPHTPYISKVLESFSEIGAKAIQKFRDVMNQLYQVYTMATGTFRSARH